MMMTPTVVPPINATAPTTQKMATTDSKVSSTSDVGNPVTIVSPKPRACVAMTRYRPSPSRSTVDRFVGRRDRRELLRCGRADFGLAAVGGDDTGVDHRSAGYHRTDRAGGLPRRIEEIRARGRSCDE